MQVAMQDKSRARHAMAGSFCWRATMTAEDGFLLDEAPVDDTIS